jgi:hypothetical protein
MSRYVDGDDDDEFAALNYGRWQRNARAVLKGKRGRKVLAEIREALLALPEKRLIEGALCTVGGPERVPEVTDAEADARYQRRRERDGDQYDPRWYTREEIAAWMRDEVLEAREAITENTRGQGCGVCVNGALLWHRLVKDGMTPEEAFAALPAVTSADGGDPLEETARIAEKEAGIAYTLAWELAYRNDETYRRMTPEERYGAFLAWINAELGDSAAQAAS